MNTTPSLFVLYYSVYTSKWRSNLITWGDGLMLSVMPASIILAQDLYLGVSVVVSGRNLKLGGYTSLSQYVRPISNTSRGDGLFVRVPPPQKIDCVIVVTIVLLQHVCMSCRLYVIKTPNMTKTHTNAIRFPRSKSIVPHKCIRSKVSARS